MDFGSKPKPPTQFYVPKAGRPDFGGGMDF